MNHAHDRNVVYVSDQLESRYPSVVRGLHRILAGHRIPLRALRGTKDIWCRDYMPIQVSRGEFVWFRYAPDYLGGDEQLITRPRDVEPIPEIERCEHSGIVVDGGNIVRWGSRCIVTEKVFSENPGLGRQELRGKLQALLRVDDLIVIPREPYDKLGHADGVVQFVDEGTVVVNDYSEVAPRYRKRLTSALRQAGLRWFEIPYAPREGVRDIPPAFGCYVNFLMASGLVVVPSYGIDEDEQARRVIEKIVPASATLQVDCCGPAMEGGSLHCVTWDIGGHPRPDIRSSFPRGLSGYSHAMIEEDV